MTNNYAKGTFIKRLDVFIKSKYETRKNFCSSLEIPYSTLNGYYTRGTNPGFDFFEKFLDRHTSDELLWLIKGEQPTNISVGENTGVYELKLNPYDNFMASFKEVIQHELSKA